MLEFAQVQMRIEMRALMVTQPAEDDLEDAPRRWDATRRREAR